MVALISVLVIVLLSLLITRVATVALAQTGMSRESARFQARSALSGVGFTTSEAESVVNHPVRRRIVQALMVVGSAGVVTAAASLILSFGGTHNDARAQRGAILVGGLAILWILSRSEWFDRHLSRLVARVLRWRGYDVRDFGRLLHLQGDWAVSELVVEPEDWLAGQTLGELKLRDEGVAVLGIQRGGGQYVGVPRGDAVIEAGDTLILYSTEDRLEELDARSRGRAGDAAHEEASHEFERALSG
jgi:K+/H+ antiporter YhaU regulatory subunit KhtT